MKDEKKYSSAFSLQPSAFNLQPCPSGFTLIELLIVIFIISLALSIVMPSLDIGGSTLKTEARHIGGALRYINDEATGKKQTYLFNVNLNDESWGFEGDTEKRKTFLRGNAEITDILIPSLGEVSSGEVIVEFGPMGADEPIILHIKKGKSEYTIIFNNINGRAEIVEGYTL